MYGSNYAPPAVGVSTGFGDLATTHWAAAWINNWPPRLLFNGCGGGTLLPRYHRHDARKQQSSS
ncbi:MAG: hypothetical protein IPL71_15245 [Anaerolineales bacterium]|uniref:hypothetical protein n=1 Tax=Candidatus Villigracilis proximus TaxID=3140683 RepID=UPI003136245B|nr:hypothetical protein [Anaerolineales bacterium]